MTISSEKSKSKLGNAYADVFRMFKFYFSIYGGTGALARSPYLHGAVILTVISYNAWQTENWWESSLTTLPNLLGFTLAGYAVLIAFGDDNLRKVLAAPSATRATSPFLQMNGQFVHFVVIQIFALLYSIAAKANPLGALSDFLYLFSKTCIIKSILEALPYVAVGGNAFGYLLFLYSVTLGIPAVFAILRYAKWFDFSEKLRREAENKNSTSSQNLTPPNNQS